MENNFTKKVDSIEADVLELKNKLSAIENKPKEEQQRIVADVKPMFFDSILGKIKILKDTTSNVSRNFPEQIVLVSTNGRHYLGLNFNDGWFYIRASSKVTSNIT